MPEERPTNTTGKFGGNGFRLREGEEGGVRRLDMRQLGRLTTLAFEQRRGGAPLASIHSGEHLLPYVLRASLKDRDKMATRHASPS